MSQASVTEGLVCRPNISAAGRRMRTRVGVVATVVGLGLAVGFAALHVGWAWRAVVFLPAATAAVGFLQARRHTCLKHAAAGTFEHDDLSATPAPADEVAASRAVAAGITRDAVMVGLASAALSMGSAFVVG